MPARSRVEARSANGGGAPAIPDQRPSRSRRTRRRDLAAAIPLVRADPDQLHQVLLNLLINAQQALQDRPAPRRIAVRSGFDRASGQVPIRVEDNGPGIAPHLRARIFEPYFTTKAIPPTALARRVRPGQTRWAGTHACLPTRLPMLELRPTCEHCNKALPPNSAEARICSYECTFCATCVDTVLGNVCPNCGGAFVARPIRPARNWKGDNFLGHDPASTKVRHRPVDPSAHAAFAAPIRSIPPEER